MSFVSFQESSQMEKWTTKLVADCVSFAQTNQLQINVMISKRKKNRSCFGVNQAPLEGPTSLKMLKKWFCVGKLSFFTFYFRYLSYFVLKLTSIFIFIHICISETEKYVTKPKKTWTYEGCKYLNAMKKIQLFIKNNPDKNISRPRCFLC